MVLDLNTAIAADPPDGVSIHEASQDAARCNAHGGSLHVRTAWLPAMQCASDGDRTCARKRSRPGSVRAIRSDVGPLFEQGSVEPFDLAVGLWSIWPGELVHDVAKGVVEDLGAVAPTVVGQNSFDDDAVQAGPGLGPFPERCCGFLLLVGEGFGIGHPAVAVDG